MLFRWRWIWNEPTGENLLPVTCFKVRFPTVVKRFHNLYLLRWGQSHEHVIVYYKILVEVGSQRVRIRREARPRSSFDMFRLAPSNLGLQELKQPTQVQVYQFPVGVQLSDCNCTFLWKTVQFGGDKLGQKLWRYGHTIWGIIKGTFFSTLVISRQLVGGTSLEEAAVDMSERRALILVQMV